MARALCSVARGRIFCATKDARGSGQVFNIVETYGSATGARWPGARHQVPGRRHRKDGLGLQMGLGLE